MLLGVVELDVKHILEKQQSLGELQSPLKDWSTQSPVREEDSSSGDIKQDTNTNLQTQTRSQSSSNQTSSSPANTKSSPNKQTKPFTPPRNIPKKKIRMARDRSESFDEQVLTPLTRTATPQRKLEMHQGISVVLARN